MFIKDQASVIEIEEQELLGAAILGNNKARLRLCLCRDETGRHVSRGIDDWAFAWVDIYQRRRELRKRRMSF